MSLNNDNTTATDTNIRNDLLTNSEVKDNENIFCQKCFKANNNDASFVNIVELN